MPSRYTLTLYIYTYTYIYICIYIYIYISMYISGKTDICINIRTYSFLFSPRRRLSCLQGTHWPYIYTYTYIYMYIYMYLSMFTSGKKCICINIRTFFHHEDASRAFKVHIDPIYIYIHTYIHTYTYVHIYMYLSMYTSRKTCICINIRTYSFLFSPQRRLSCLQGTRN
jgi:hypothetical protein